MTRVLTLTIGPLRIAISWERNRPGSGRRRHPAETALWLKKLEEERERIRSEYRLKGAAPWRP